MKVIFLDFDGVINNWNEMDGVSLYNVIVLKEILKRTNAKIVATTSNKYSFQRPKNAIDYYSTNYYQNYILYLKELGIEIYDVTPYVNANRTLEIEQYLKEHDIEDYVIVDDELVGPSLQDHQVFLDLYLGLQSEHIEPILRILDGELGFYPKSYNRNETPEELSIRINNYHNHK